MNHIQKYVLVGLLLSFSNLTFPWYENPGEMLDNAPGFREKNPELAQELEDAYAAVENSPLYQQEEANRHNYEKMIIGKQALSVPKALWYVLKGQLSLQDIHHNQLKLQDFRMKCIESVTQRKKSDPSYPKNYKDCGECDTPECEFYRTMEERWQKQEKSAYNKYIKASQTLDNSPEGKKYSELRSQMRQTYCSHNLNQ
jgi:hypothetical protein